MVYGIDTLPLRRTYIRCIVTFVYLINFYAELISSAGICPAAGARPGWA